MNGVTVYFVSGLGADERVFQFLSLPGINKKFIKWPAPASDETIRQYAQRLIHQIDLSDEIVLIGISFGGIIVQEIASQISCEKVIIISSVKSPKEFSWQLSLVKKTGVYKLFPAWFLKWSNKLTADYYFSTESKKESDLLHQIINDTDEKFMMWAIRRIMEWKNDNIAGTIIHIHGTSDRIFPTGSIDNAIMINNGGHFMIVNKSEQISKIIMDEINPQI
jgi:pimeloyl-ACP methyl ester carboxylesterase